ncbi:hypothetical protein FRC10_002874 [Ceratobasidium sp. 414]|nr:hypothetical protein FRC10_002874 [Ceratobasidium sp. 414]
MALYLSFKNKQHAAARRRAGKKAVVIDVSLEDSKTAREATEKNNATEGEDIVKRRLNDQAFNDLTDLQNEDFIYVLSEYVAAYKYIPMLTGAWK